MLNLVYINTHDTGRAISPYGYNVPTENLKELAKDATLFTNAFCCGPTCSPSRAALLTGTFPHQNGMLGLAQRGFSLFDPSKHLANYLRKNGYHTAISGIQHETGWYLDIHTDALNEMGYSDILTNPSSEYRKEDLYIWDNLNAEKAVKWIDDYNDSKPFMLTYGMHSTHRPFPDDILEDIDERYVNRTYGVNSCGLSRNDQAKYMTSAEYADKNVKKIIDALKKKGVYENTLIIFTTDHGLPMPFNKCSLTDRGIGVSLIIRHPQLKHGVVCDDMLSHIDVFPTICDLLEIKKPEYLEGKSFAKYFVNDEKIDDQFIYSEINFHTSYEPARCIRDKRFKYIKYFDNDWKLYNLSNMDDCVPKEICLKNNLREKNKPMEALYDTYFDPEESNNLIGDQKYKEVLEVLRNQLIKHMEETKDPLLDGELEIKPNYKVNKKECVIASSKNPDDYDQRGRTH